METATTNKSIEQLDHLISTIWLRIFSSPESQEFAETFMGKISAYMLST
jgi:hypothetical protein